MENQTQVQHIEQKEGLKTEVQEPKHVGFSFDLSSIINSNLINFIIVVIFVAWLIKKFNILGAIDAKKQKIEESIDALEQEKSQSKELLEKTADKVKNTEKEMDDIVTNAADIANTLLTKSLIEAENDANELIARGKRTIQGFNDNVSEQIKHQVSVAALKIAEEHIKKAIDENKHKQLINEFIDNLDELKVH